MTKKTILSLTFCLLFLQGCIKEAEPEIYGPYICGDKQLILTQRIKYSRLEGAMSNLDISLVFGPYTLHKMKFPPASIKESGGMTMTTFMDDKAKADYLKTNGFKEAGLKRPIRTGYDNGGVILLDGMVADQPMGKDLYALQSCLDANADTIDADIRALRSSKKEIRACVQFSRLLSR